MATIARQSLLWRTFQPSEAPGLLEVRAFLATLSRFDEKLVVLLERERGNGRDDYPVRALWHTVALGPLLRHSKFTDILGELGRNPLLAIELGYRVTPEGVALPKKWVLSRFWKTLKARLHEMGQMLDDTVLALIEKLPGLGQCVAGDASDVRTHARARKAKKEDTGAVPPPEGPTPEAKPAPSSPPAEKEAKPSPLSADPEASWSVKTKTYEEKGVVKTKTTSTFGYKLHAVVDSRRPVILSCTTTTGKTPDIAKANEVLDHAVELLGTGTIREAAYDKAFDDESFVKHLEERKIAALIPVRDVPENLQKLPKEDREVSLAPGDNVSYDKYTGEVVCYDMSGKDPVRHTMLYGGYEEDRETHKFRCPAAGGAFSCPFRDVCGGGHFGKTGRQVRIPKETDRRRFATVYPRSKRWRRSFRRRSAVERCFSILKTGYDMEEHALRGMSSIHLRVLFCALTLNLTTYQRATAPTVDAAAPPRCMAAGGSAAPALRSSTA